MYYLMTQQYEIYEQLSVYRLPYLLGIPAKTKYMYINPPSGRKYFNDGKVDYMKR